MSETTNLRLFKHDNSATNTDQFDIEKSLNENLDKIDETYGQLNTEKEELKNKQTELEAELQAKVEELRAENERLKQDLNGLPTGQAEGEIIDITDSAEMRFSEFNISGNSVQETSTQGNNILDFTKWTVTGKANIEVVSVEANEMILKNTSTNDNTACYWRGKKLLKAGTYYFSRECETTEGTDSERCGVMQFQKVSDWSVLLTLAKATSKGTFTLTEDTEIYMSINVVGGTETGVDVRTLRIYNAMLSLSNIDYEEFIPNMPSTEYPSEVKSVGDNINLIGIPETSEKIVSGVNVSASNEIVNLNGTNELTYNSNLITNILYSIEEATNYNLSITEIAGTREGMIGIKGIGSNGTQQWYIQLANTSVSVYKEITAEQISNTASIRLFMGGSAIFNDYQFKIKLEKGSKSTGCSQYGQGCINEVICNKNVLDIEQFKNLNNKNTYETYNEIECLKLCGVTQRYYFKAKENTQYTFQFKYVGYTYAEIGAFLFEYEDGTSSTIKYVGTALGVFSATSEKNKTLRCIRWSGWSEGHYIYIDKNSMQLEQGTTATDCVPHQSQTFSIPTQRPFRAIGNVKDAFVKVNNEWYEKHYIEEFILDGSENWTKQSYQNQYYFRLQLDNSGNLACDLGMSTHLNFIESIASLLSYTYSFRIATGNLDIVLDKTSISVDDFKAWLIENSVAIHYILQTPTLIKCTEEQSTILWDIEQNAKTYKNITHIFSTDNVSPNVEVTYKKDIETLFANTLVGSGV